MNADDPTPFEDPALKSAVKLAWAREQCPHALRQKIHELLSDQSQAAAPLHLAHRPMMAGRWFIWPLAAAALVVLAVGVRAMLRQSSSPQVQLVTAFPEKLQNELIDRHDHCCQHANHQGLPVAKDDDAAIASAMHTRLSRAVLMTRPDEPGWTFRGASICPVGTTPCGHLVFAKGTNAISVFSMPDSIDPGVHDGNHFEMTSHNHQIVAFAKDGGLFCIVGSGSNDAVSLDQLSRMRDRMEADVTASNPTEPRVTLAGLMYSSKK